MYNFFIKIVVTIYTYLGLACHYVAWLKNVQHKVIQENTLT